MSLQLSGAPALAAPRPLPAPPGPAGEGQAGRRVLVLVRFPVGGIRMHIHYTYPLLQEAGYRFTFVLPDYPGAEPFIQTARGFQGAEVVGVPIRRRRCALWRTARGLLAGGRFDLVHSHGFTAAVHGVLACLGRRVPHAATLHDVIRPEQRQGLKGRLRCWALGHLFRRLDAIVPCAHHVAANLLDGAPPLRACRDRIVVIPNGIDVAHHARPAGPSEPLRDRLQLEPQTRLLGFLGRFMEEKGFPVLLAALARLRGGGCPPFHLVAFGSGDREAGYRKELARLGLGRDVTILPFVPDVQPVLRQLDLLVVPSLTEAMPLLPMEALVAGVPVLASACNGLREVLEGTPSRLVPVGDSVALAEGIRDALAEPWAGEARSFTAEACRRYDRGPRARRLLDLFEQLLARPGGLA